MVQSVIQYLHDLYESKLLWFAVAALLFGTFMRKVVAVRSGRSGKWAAATAQHDDSTFGLICVLLGIVLLGIKVYIELKSFGVV